MLCHFSGGTLQLQVIVRSSDRTLAEALTSEYAQRRASLRLTPALPPKLSAMPYTFCARLTPHNMRLAAPASPSPSRASICYFLSRTRLPPSFPVETLGVCRHAISAGRTLLYWSTRCHSCIYYRLVNAAVSFDYHASAPLYDDFISQLSLEPVGVRRI